MSKKIDVLGLLSPELKNKIKSDQMEKIRREEERRKDTEIYNKLQKDGGTILKQDILPVVMEFESIFKDFSCTENNEYGLKIIIFKVNKLSIQVAKDRKSVSLEIEFPKESYDKPHKYSFNLIDYPNGKPKKANLKPFFTQLIDVIVKENYSLREDIKFPSNAEQFIEDVA